jgi:hypothetical protein
VTNPDSCTDTDGGSVVTVKGTVSGYQNNVPFSYDDTCLNNITLAELYCSSSKKPLNFTYNCNTNMTSICLNGACV